MAWPFLKQILGVDEGKLIKHPHRGTIYFQVATKSPQSQKPSIIKQRQSLIKTVPTQQILQQQQPVERHRCRFCDKDYSLAGNTRAHEKKVHPLEYEQAEQIYVNSPQRGVPKQTPKNVLISPESSDVPVADSQKKNRQRDLNHLRGPKDTPKLQKAPAKQSTLDSIKVILGKRGAP